VLITPSAASPEPTEVPVAEAERALSTDSDALSRPANSAPHVKHPAIDRRVVMTRAHIVAKRFRDLMPSYREALAYAFKTVWADIKARAEDRERYKHIVRRVLTPDERAASERATRRCGASYMPF
jgi:hypothetical protein